MMAIAKSLFRYSSVVFISLLFLASAAHAQPIEIEVALQDGGEGQEIFQRIARMYEAQRPGIKINVYGDPRIGDLLRVRILEKDFPEITNGDFGGWNLIRHGDIQSLNEALDGPDWDHTGGSWRDSFLPGTLDRYTEAGKSYAVPLSYYVWSIWYNRRMFKAHHWQSPATWDQLLNLCKSIKESGIAPFAFQGRYPYYAQAFVDSAYYQEAGKEAFAAQKRLEPGSFDNQAMRIALGYAQTLATNYFQTGAMGMGHTLRVVAQERNDREDTRWV
jgi:ABC-type glycerol-3-phosphate transport system substrate-binding protein